MKRDKIKISSNKSFGIVFFIVFLIFSIYPIINDNEIRVWSIVVSIIFLIMGLRNSRYLTPLNIIWFKFGILLGNLISPIVMGLIFFTIVTPIGLLMRIFSKNFLNLKKNNDSSYWVKTSNQKSKMKNQF
jgi:hypothetical protein|tara:strand:+ start:636 stop:1025 length:390 start_codon:yes stop_codon:yes gene_type:complete